MINQQDSEQFISYIQNMTISNNFLFTHIYNYIYMVNIQKMNDQLSNTYSKDGVTGEDAEGYYDFILKSYWAKVLSKVDKFSMKQILCNYSFHNKSKEYIIENDIGPKNIIIRNKTIFFNSNNNVSEKVELYSLNREYYKTLNEKSDFLSCESYGDLLLKGDIICLTCKIIDHRVNYEDYKVTTGFTEISVMSLIDYIIHQLKGKESIGYIYSKPLIGSNRDKFNIAIPICTTNILYHAKYTIPRILAFITKGNELIYNMNWYKIYIPLSLNVLQQYVKSNNVNYMRIKYEELIKCYFYIYDHLDIKKYMNPSIALDLLNKHNSKLWFSNWYKILICYLHLRMPVRGFNNQMMYDRILFREAVEELYTIYKDIPDNSDDKELLHPELNSIIAKLNELEITLVKFSEIFKYKYNFVYKPDLDNIIKISKKYILAYNTGFILPMHNYSHEKFSTMVNQQYKYNLSDKKTKITMMNESIKRGYTLIP